MGNLGWYQNITKYSKIVGGPKNFIGIVAVGGYLIFRTVEAVAHSTVVKIIDKKDVNSKDNEVCQFIVNNKQEDEMGNIFYPGDTMTIVAKDGDSFLIVRNNDKNDILYISKTFFYQLIDKNVKK
ncbi:hypothetical protein [Carnobacterium maltaromaticum]|uniref:hypothetical protein n=1 Tax=Carnobacterium maltaromaticum TaxID=2751 RepID=UPI0039AFD70B